MGNAGIMQHVGYFADAQFSVEQQLLDEFHFLQYAVFLDSHPLYFSEQFAQCAVFLETFSLKIFGKFCLVLIFRIMDIFYHSCSDAFYNLHPFVVYHLEPQFFQRPLDFPDEGVT